MADEHTGHEMVSSEVLDEIMMAIKIATISHRREQCGCHLCFALARLRAAREKP